MGICTSDMVTALPDWLKFPVELDGQVNMAVHDAFLLAAKFYVQIAFDYLGCQPSLPHIHSVS